MISKISIPKQFSTELISHDTIVDKINELVEKVNLAFNGLGKLTEICNKSGIIPCDKNFKVDANIVVGLIYEITKKDSEIKRLYEEVLYLRGRVSK